MTTQTPPTDRPLTAGELEQIAHNLCSLHDFDVALVAGLERFAKAVITEYERARPATSAASEGEGERDLFERWYCDDANACGMSFSPAEIAKLRNGDGYGRDRIALNSKWEAWQGRAALASPPSELLREARWYVNDHQESQPNDESKDLLARIDEALK